MLNLTKAEGKDLLLLKNNSELFIKEAKKEGCVVLMNKLHYKKKAFQHLNGGNFFDDQPLEAS